MYQTIAPGIDVYSFETLTSTQDQARVMVEEGFDDGTVVTSKEQIHGRGRRGKAWVSETGNLFMTYIARPGCPVAKSAELSFVTCVAVGDALRSLMGKNTASLKYKWPNDLMLNKKKAGGIILETVGKNPENIDAVLIGIGINLQAFPEGAEYPVTSFLQEGCDLGVDISMKTISQYLQAAINMWSLQGFAPIKNRWLEHVYGMGEKLTVKQGDTIFQGEMKGINESGALIMSSKLGAQDVITAGDVMFGDVTTVKEVG